MDKSQPNNKSSNTKEYQVKEEPPVLPVSDGVDKVIKHLYDTISDDTKLH